MHIDVRSIHPVLFIGLRSYVLDGQKRDISVGDALVLLRHRQVLAANVEQVDGRFIRL